MKNNFAWISWERQQRNISMARLFQATYFEFNDLPRGIFRYFVYIKRTLSIFLKSYSIIFVQNPSIILSFVGVILGMILRKKVVIDAHNAGVRPLEGRYKLVQNINKWILRHAYFVIVTNAQLKNLLESYSISSFVLPDPLPEMTFSPDKVSSSAIPYDILVVCSWAEDEPIHEYLLAAKALPDLTFAFTGNSTRFLTSNNDVEIPENVTLLGFVLEADYIWLMKYSKLIIDMTKRQDCLVCGAYEAISLEKPVILSDTRVNKELFGNAAIYCSLSSDELINIIDSSITDTSELESHIRVFTKKYSTQQLQHKNEILKIINSSQ